MIKYRYVRDKKYRPRGLVVLDTNNGNMGWSYCCSQDIFSKKIAKEIAIARLNKGKVYDNVPRPVIKEMEKTRKWYDTRKIASTV